MSLKDRKIYCLNNIRSCVSEDIRDGKDEAIDEFVRVLQKLMK